MVIEKGDLGALREPPQGETFLFPLFVAGNEIHSRIALDNLRAICETCHSGCQEIEVVDVLECADAALERSIFVTPALIKPPPGTRCTLYGNPGGKEKVIQALGLSGANP
jgi:hypothetical protein